VLYISKIYVCRMEMEIRVSICMSILGTLQRLSYKENVSTARLEIPFLSYVIELPRSGLRSDCVVLFVHKTDRVPTRIMQTRSQRVNSKLLYAVSYAKLPRNCLPTFTMQKLFRDNLSLLLLI